MDVNILNYQNMFQNIKKVFYIQPKNKSNIYIYKITNLKNNKCYIGKTHNIENRVSQYINNYINNTRKTRKIHRAFGKYNIINFRMEVIDIADDDEGVQKEIYYIKKYNSVENGYNDNYSSCYHKKKTRHGNYGKLHTPETKARKSKFIAAVNITENKIVFSSGMKLFADYINSTKDIVSHAYNRCGSVYGYYIVSINPNDSEKQLCHINKLMNKKSKQKKMQNKCLSFLFSYQLVFETLEKEILKSDYKYIVITQSDEDEKYKKADMNIVYDYYKISR